MENNVNQLNQNLIEKKRRNFPKHRYKYGKIVKGIDFAVFSKLLGKVDTIDTGKYSKLLAKSLLTILYWTGLRKTEVIGSKAHKYVLKPCKRHAELITKTTEAIPGILKEDIEVKGDTLIIHAVARKHGKREAPLELFLDLPYVNLIVEQWKQTLPKQRVWPISEWDAWQIMKRVDAKKYLHFFRFNRISEFCGDPEMSIKEIASWTGLTIPTIESYMERSGRYIRTAAEKMRRRYIKY
jgi:hypothetical protein